MQKGRPSGRPFSSTPSGEGATLSLDLHPWAGRVFYVISSSRADGGATPRRMVCEGRALLRLLVLATSRQIACLHFRAASLAGYESGAGVVPSGWARPGSAPILSKSGSAPLWPYPDTRTRTGPAGTRLPQLAPDKKDIGPTTRSKIIPDIFCLARFYLFPPSKGE